MRTIVESDTVPQWLARQPTDLRHRPGSHTGYTGALSPAPLPDPLGQQAAGVAKSWS